MKFVDFFAGGGGASLGAESTRLFQATLAVDCDADALAVYSANLPDAKTAQLTLPCEHSKLKALLPIGEQFHLHASPPTISYTRRGIRDDNVDIVRWTLDFALASGAYSFSLEVTTCPMVTALLETYKPRVAVVEVDAGDLGNPSRRARTFCGTPGLMRALSHRAKYERTFQSVADALRASNFAIKKSHFRNSSISPSAPPEVRRALVLPVGEASRTLSKRLSLTWCDDPSAVAADEVYETMPFSLEESAVVAGLPPTFQLGKKRTLARALIGTATPPCVMHALLRCYGSSVAIEEPNDEEELFPTVKRRKLVTLVDPQKTMRDFLVPDKAALSPGVAAAQPVA